MRRVYGHFARWRDYIPGGCRFRKACGRRPRNRPESTGCFEPPRCFGWSTATQRLAASSSPVTRKVARLATPPAAFVELLGPGAGSLAECLIEVEGPRGRMRIEWKGPAAGPGWTEPNAVGARRLIQITPQIRILVAVDVDRGKASTAWRSYAGRNSQPIRSPDVCSFFAAVAVPPSNCLRTTAKGFGWHQAFVEGTLPLVADG